jgi:hypothetical protein
MIDRTVARWPCLGFAGICFLMLGIGALPLDAQDLGAERGRVLTVIGHTEAVDQPLFPLGSTVGLVFRHDIVEPGATSLRLHFVMEQPGEGWALHIRNAAGKIVWSTSDETALSQEFWSDEIPGEKAVVEIHSSRPTNPTKLRIDKIAVGDPTVTAVSISGPDQRASIVGQADWIVGYGRSVARLRFIGDDGLAYVCTAFLVTHDLMLTNQHCISSEGEMASALVDFDYDEDGTIGRTFRLSELLYTNHGLDFAVVRLAAITGESPLELEIDHPEDSTQLLVIQHPGGEPKQVSIADCRVDGPLVTGRGGQPTDFGHQCDTLGGSSGSPVFRFDTRSVVGLHHLGIHPASSDLFNRATHIDLVLEAMKPAVRAEITNAQQALRSRP